MENSIEIIWWSLFGWRCILTGGGFEGLERLGLLLDSFDDRIRTGEVEERKCEWAGQACLFFVGSGCIQQSGNATWFVDVLEGSVGEKMKNIVIMVFSFRRVRENFRRDIGQIPNMKLWIVQSIIIPKISSEIMTSRKKQSLNKLSKLPSLDVRWQFIFLPLGEIKADCTSFQ